MGGKTEDELVDIESASGGSVNDDSDDEGTLPSEIDDRVHLEVSHVDVFFLTFVSLFFFPLNFFMANFFYDHIKTWVSIFTFPM